MAVDYVCQSEEKLQSHPKFPCFHVIKKSLEFSLSFFLSFALFVCDICLLLPLDICFSACLSCCLAVPLSFSLFLSLSPLHRPSQQLTINQHPPVFPYPHTKWPTTTSFSEGRTNNNAAVNTHFSF